jgi:hypothetical protein
MLKEVGPLFARVFARVDDHLGALLGAFRDVLPGIGHSVVGKRERFFRSIGGYDDEFFRAPINSFTVPLVTSRPPLFTLSISIAVSSAPRLV